jgi:hypothetical protein
MRKFWAAAAFAPWISLVVSVPLFVALVGVEEGERIPVPYTELTMFLAGLAVGWLCIAAFAVHAARNPRLDRRNRRLWIAAIVFVNGFALPLYWWTYIRGDAASSTSG